MEIGDTVKLINIENTIGFEELNTEKFFVKESGLLVIGFKPFKDYDEVIFLNKDKFVYAKMILTEKIKWNKEIL